MISRISTKSIWQCINRSVYSSGLHCLHLKMKCKISKSVKISFENLHFFSLPFAILTKDIPYTSQNEWCIVIIHRLSCIIPWPKPLYLPYPSLAFKLCGTIYLAWQHIHFSECYVSRAVENSYCFSNSSAFLSGHGYFFTNLKTISYLIFCHNYADLALSLFIVDLNEVCY